MQEEKKQTEKHEYAVMKDGEIVPVYEYHYTGTVNIWTENGIEKTLPASTELVVCLGDAS